MVHLKHLFNHLKIVVQFSPPKNPVTKPNFDKVVQYESVFDFEEMINRAVENIETLEITSDYKTIKEQQTNQLINDFL